MPRIVAANRISYYCEHSTVYEGWPDTPSPSIDWYWIIDAWVAGRLSPIQRSELVVVRSRHCKGESGIDCNSFLTCEDVFAASSAEIVLMILCLFFWDTVRLWPIRRHLRVDQKSVPDRSN